MKPILQYLACACLPLLALSAQETASDKDRVLDLARQWIKAEETGQREALARIVADDFVGTGPSGNRVTKDMVIPAEGSGRAGFVKEGRDMEVLAWGTAAIVRGIGIPARTDRPPMRFTLVFAQRDGRWQMVGAHLSVIPPPE